MSGRASPATQWSAGLDKLINKITQKHAASLLSHPNLRDKDIAEIDASRQKDFHLNTPLLAPNVATLLCTEIKSQDSKLVAKNYY